MKIKHEKEIRADILSILNAAFPQGLSLGFLNKTVNEAGWDMDIDATEVQCAYLEKKGYIASDKRGAREFGTGKVIYSITANGIDLTEGNINDVGVSADG